MPWKEVSSMSLRNEFVNLASKEGANVRELCRRFEISPRTAYKWLARYSQDGIRGLEEKSRRPLRSPNRTSPEIEDSIISVRRENPAWGGRKIYHWLGNRDYTSIPAPSTINTILRRNGLINQNLASQHKPWQRFEYPAPNMLWQMDFKGSFQTSQISCYPLTVLDDHSRFALAIEACDSQRAEVVQERLEFVFRHYGLPLRLVMDNGAQWGSRERPYTDLTIWLMRLGISVSHGRPYHPQTQGKDERFHRTLKAEVLQGRTFRDLIHCQQAFDKWRQIYNLERPHQALDYATPASRYTPSPISFPDSLPQIEYGPNDLVRKVQQFGELYFKNKIFKIGNAFYGLPVALRPTADDNIWQVYFLTHLVALIDLRKPDKR